MLALLLDRIELPKLWVPLFGVASPLTSVLCHRSCLPLFIDYSRHESSCAEPGLEVPLNSYLEWVLYKFEILLLGIHAMAQSNCQ